MGGYSAGVAIIIIFVVLADLLYSTSNSNLKKPKGVCKDLTGSAYSYMIATIIGRKDVLDKSVIDAFTHPIRYTRFGLAKAPLGGKLESVLDLTKRYPGVVERS